jgi:predicted alpha/beta hydrolase
VNATAQADDTSAARPRSFQLRALDGRQLAANWFTGARERRGVIVLSGGTGFPQTFYFRIAQYAVERGYDTLVYDYRGMGESAPADLALERTSMSDWGLYDIPAALDEALRHAAGIPVVTFGHSIGAQFVGLLKKHARAAAHVHIAACTGYWRWEGVPFRYLAWWFWRVHGPLMLKIHGYIPTGGGWAGQPLPRGVYEEWRRWCLRPSHFAPDLETYLAGNVFAEVREPLLSVGFEDDQIATHRTVSELAKFYGNARREERWYHPRDIGSARIGHEGFFSSRHRESLWRPVFDWIDGILRGAA